MFAPPTAGAGGARAPFVLLLHGYGGTGASIARHFGFDQIALERRFYFLAPDGMLDSKNARFWNAQEACCDFDHKGPDHIGQLAAIIAAARADARIDPEKIYVVGFSNGGFMAHRLGCDVPGIAGIASVAGAAVPDPSTCKNAPKTILQIHGDADNAVAFEGGHVLKRTELPRHLGALAGVRGWAKQAGCDRDPKVSGKVDLDANIEGSESERFVFECAPGIRLFKVHGGTHGVAADKASMRRILDELMVAKAP